ncbi:MAG TPA: hypothetical protein VJN18_31380 [Polyangiaceae bacterium]|nr:hypothetical protein [Polyangiaceae bacterium]
MSFAGALSHETIPGEVFSHVWGTDSELWILGKRHPRPPAQPTAKCGFGRGEVSSVLRRRTTGAFELVDHPPMTDITSMRGTSSSDLWLVGLGGGVYQFDGRVWHQHDIRPAVGPEFKEEACWELSLHSVFPRSPDDVWIVGYVYPDTTGTGAGLVLHYDGKGWKRHVILHSVGLFGVWAAGVADVWVVGESGRLFHYDGRSWLPENAATDQYLRSVLGTGASDIWAVGNMAVATHFDGTSWKLRAANQLHWTMGSLAGSANGGFWALMTATFPDRIPWGGQSLIHWDGSAWRAMSHTTDKHQAMADLYMTPGGQLWAVGAHVIRFR